MQDARITDLEDVRIYGTAWCPAVLPARALLDERGIAYAYHDIDDDKKAAKALYRIQRGRRRVPTLVFPDGTVLVEPDEAELTAFLDTFTPGGANEADPS